MKLGFVMLEYHFLQTEVDLIRVLTGSLVNISVAASTGRSSNDVVCSALFILKEA